MKDILFDFFQNQAPGYAVSLVFLLLPTGTAPPLIGVGVALLIWIMSGGAKRVPSFLGRKWFRPMFLFLVLPWLGLIYSTDIDLGIDYAMKTIYWILLFVTATCPMDDQRILGVVKALWTGLVIGALLAMGQTAGVIPMIKNGFPGFGIVHTLVCMYLLVGILMAAFYFRRSETFKARVFLILLIMTFLFHLAVLGGRSGYLIYILISPLVAKDLMYKFSLSAKIIISVFLGLSILLSPIVRERITTTARLLAENPDEAVNGDLILEIPRLYMVKESFNLIKRHPIIGIGTGSLRSISSAQGYEFAHPHNNFLYMGVSFGVVGLISLAWVFWNMFRISWQARNTPLGYFAFTSTLVLFIGGMFDSQILNTGTLIMLSMVFGFLNQLSEQNQGSV